ncbi:MAG: hypothetical protein J6J16_03800 [Lachnospiraceae bacterium]|nr:hypothetical protein [Lachnospiraceae bacterium]
MNERKLKQLNILVLVSVLASFIVMGLFIFVFSPGKENRIDTDNLKKYNESWVLKSVNGSDDKILDLPINVDASAGDTIILMNRVPEDVNSDTVLVVKTEFQNILVTVNDKKIYSNGVLNDQKLMKNAVPCYNIIDLGNAKPGDVVAIHIASGYDKYSGKLGNIYYGTRGGAVADIVRDNGVSFVVAVAILVLTLVLVVSLLFMKNVNVNKMKSAYAFGFIFTAALWSITGNPIMQLITGNTFGTYMSNMVLLLIMPVLYIMYQRCFAVKRRFAKIFEIGIYVFAINFVTGVVFQFYSVCDFATYEIFTKILITIGLVLLSGIMYLAADTFADKTIYNNFFANMVLTMACIFEAFFSLFNFYKGVDGIILQIGVYLFVVLLVITVEKGIIKEMNQQRDNALSNIDEEKKKTVKHINTQLIYSALNIVVNDLKPRDRENSRLVYDTSIYLKNNLKSITDRDLVPFSEELEYIKAYLGIQAKKNEMLEVTVEDKVIDFNVPFNTIEPLVENAVQNGALRADSDGRIVVRSYERLDCFAIQIVDNGKGIGPDKRFDGKQSFKNIKRRLKKMCGGGIDVNNKPGKGTIVTVKIPKEGFIIKE